MGHGKEEKKGSAIGSAVVATASVALGYAALELGLGGVLKPGREHIKHSLEPQDKAAAQQQASQLVANVKQDAKAHEATTNSSMKEPELAESLQKHAAAAATTPDSHQ